MEDYLPQKNIQKSIQYMWRRYGIEREKHRLAHERIRTHLTCGVVQIAKKIRLSFIFQGKEKVL